MEKSQTATKYYNKQSILSELIFSNIVIVINAMEIMQDKLEYQNF